MFRIEVNHVKSGFFFASILNFASEAKVRAHPKCSLVRIFSSNKSAPTNRKKEFYTNRDPNKQEVGFIFCMKWLRTLKSFQMFRTETVALTETFLLLRGFLLLTI